MAKVNGFVVTLFVVAVIGAYTGLGGPDSGMVLLLPGLLGLAGIFDAHLDLLADNRYRVHGAVMAGVVAGMGSFVLTVAAVTGNLLAILSGSGLVLSALIALEVSMERLSDVELQHHQLRSNHTLNAVFFAVGAVTMVPSTVLLIGYQPVLIALMLLTLVTVTLVAFIYNERTRKHAIEAVREAYAEYM